MRFVNINRVGGIHNESVCLCVCVSVPVQMDAFQLKQEKKSCCILFKFNAVARLYGSTFSSLHFNIINVCYLLVPLYASCTYDQE